jgi:hypothetical protein
METVVSSEPLEVAEELLMAALNESAKAAMIILLLNFGIALPGLVWSMFRRVD